MSKGSQTAHCYGLSVAVDNLRYTPRSLQLPPEAAHTARFRHKRNPLPRCKLPQTFYLRGSDPEPPEPAAGGIKIDFSKEQETIDDHNDGIIGSAFDRLVKLESDMEHRLKSSTSCYAVALRHRDLRRSQKLPRPRTVPFAPKTTHPWGTQSIPRWDSRRTWVEPFTYRRGGAPDNRTTRKLDHALNAPERAHSPRARSPKPPRDYF